MNRISHGPPSTCHFHFIHPRLSLFLQHHLSNYFFILFFSTSLGCNDISIYSLLIEPYSRQYDDAIQLVHQFFSGFHFCKQFHRKKKKKIQYKSSKKSGEDAASSSSASYLFLWGFQSSREGYMIYNTQIYLYFVFLYIYI